MRQFSASVPLFLLISADRWRRMRWISCCSASVSCLTSLLSSTTAIGSMKSVAPVADWSWTMPGKRERYSCLTGMT